MLSEAEQRIKEFEGLLTSSSREKTSQLRRPLILMKTCQRNMDWIIETSSWFSFPPECMQNAKELKSHVSNVINKINDQIYDNQSKKTKHVKSLSQKQDLEIMDGGAGILSGPEIHYVDLFIERLEGLPPVDYVALHESSKKQRLSEMERMLSDGLTFGEATSAHPILNQPYDDFRSSLSAINSNVIEQIKLIEYYLPRWFSMGEFPPPNHAWRIAIILRKAKEYGREHKFLYAYLLNFRSRLGASRKDEMLVERAEHMGIQLPPVR